MKIVVILERAGDGWGAYTPQNSLCVNACPDTRDETIRLFVEALRFHMDGMREEGMPFPEITELELQETLSLPKMLAT